MKELTKLEKVKAEVERLREGLVKTETWWRNAQTYGMKMERSRNALKGPLAQMKARAEKAEAQLEKQRPLIAAVMGTDEITFIGTSSPGADRLIRAALKLREGAGK